MPGVPTQLYTVANLDQWGRLVKSWTTHLDYINQDYPNQPPRTNWVNTTWPGEAGRTPGPATVPDTNPATGAPFPWCLPPMTSVNVAQADGTNVAINAVAMTTADFTARVTAAGVTISTMPDAYTSVVIVQGSANTMVLRLPPTDKVESAEDDLLNGLVYPLPAFYSALFGGPPTMPTNNPDIMKLHAYRIGEYTMNVCD